MCILFLTIAAIDAERKVKGGRNFIKRYRYEALKERRKNERGMKMRKHLSILLVLSLLFALFAGAAYAEGEVEELYDVSEDAVKGEGFGIHPDYEIPIRDSYVLASDGLYYLYGTEGVTAFSGSDKGFQVYVSDDLATWQGPYTAFPNGGWDGELWATNTYWAPEVYEVDGSFYMFASWAEEGSPYGVNRYVCVLKASDPAGPFEVWNDRLIQSGNDATLYEQDGEYYLVYTGSDDTLESGAFIIKLTDDLQNTDSEPMGIFDASGDGFETGMHLEGFETWTTPTGRVILMYAVNGYEGVEGEMFSGYYAAGFAYFDNGIIGEDGAPVSDYTFDEERVIAPINCGHNNFFEDLDGNVKMSVHFPNQVTGEFGPYVVDGDYGYPYVFDVSYDAENDTLVLDRAAFYETFGDDYYNMHREGSPVVYELDPRPED